MPTSHNMPSVMCTGCKFYDYDPHSHPSHRCKDNDSFTNSGKCGQDPNNQGTSSYCKKYKSK